jgi:uracil-DNA glycosylase
LITLLEAAEVPLEDCFFTNAFIGLCEGSNSFDYRGRDNKRFRAACLLFLKAQIEFQRPRLIVSLGLHVPPMLAELSSDLSGWSGSRVRLKDIDATPMIPCTDFPLNDGTVHRATVAAIAHPSLPNGSKRTPKGFSPGKQGEIELLRAGWAECQE